MANSLNQSKSLPQLAAMNSGKRHPRSLTQREWGFLLIVPVMVLATIATISHLSDQGTAPRAFSQLLGTSSLPGTTPPPPLRQPPLLVTPEPDQTPDIQPPLTAQAATTAHKPASLWQPERRLVERQPSDHPAVNDQEQPIRVRVVTIRARVTAYTPYDHAQTHPQWADGIVAWHPGGRQRHVAEHRYGLATDWSQFPPGATYIRVPGYMESSFPNFPESFRVVDDACGQSRKARREGKQPVIDVRFMTRYSAIDPKGGWGSQELPVEVIYPAEFRIPASLKRWVVADEWHTYHDGKLIARQPR